MNLGVRCLLELGAVTATAAMGRTTLGIAFFVVATISGASNRAWD